MSMYVNVFSIHIPLHSYYGWFCPPTLAGYTSIIPRKNLQNHLQFWGNFPQNDHQFCGQLPNGKAIATHGGPMAPWAASRRDFARCRAAARGRPSSKDLGRSQIIMFSMYVCVMYIIYGVYVFFNTFIHTHTYIYIHYVCTSNAMCQLVSKSGRPLVILGVEYGEGETCLNLYSCAKCMQTASTANFKGGACP